MRYAFADTEIDTVALELRQSGVVRPVEPQVFEVLRVLIENRHRVMSRDELVEDVWRGRIVSDSAIAGRIKAARQAIGDDGKEQRLIRTMNRRGYRFVGEVVVQDEPNVVGTHAIERPVAEPPVVVEDAAPAEKTDWTNTFPACDGRPSIAVLPFEMRVGFELLQRAIRLDPGFARAHAALSFAHFQQAFNQYPGVDIVRSGKSAAAFAERGLELDEFYPFCLLVRGRVSWLSGEVEQSLDWLDRAT